MRNRHQQNGFSLLELSIVLLVIGLVISGIVVGKALVRTAELQSVIREYDSYLKAVGEFHDKYQALPGDMKNATKIWDSQATCAPPATA